MKIAFCQMCGRASEWRLEMNYRIENEILSVEVDSLGGELQSIKRDGREYLWQADPRYWEGKAPNLFPYIARLTEGKYTFNGKTYEMPIHGFLPTTEMVREEQSADRIVFRLDADEKTKERYPFDFTCRIVYELEEDVLNVTYQVENHGEEPMYFGIGGHPGFCVPVGSGEAAAVEPRDGREAEGEPGQAQDGGAFTRWRLEFEGVKEYETPIRIGFSPSCFLNGEDAPYELEHGTCIPLRHELFDDDAIVLAHTSKTVSLRCDNSSRFVRVHFPDMPYIGFWHAVGTDAPYVCIEPWSSLPSRQGVVEDLASQPGLIRLEGKRRYRSRWSVEIH